MAKKDEHHDEGSKKAEASHSSEKGKPDKGHPKEESSPPKDETPTAALAAAVVQTVLPEYTIQCEQGVNLKGEEVEFTVVTLKKGAPFPAQLTLHLLEGKGEISFPESKPKPELVTRKETLTAIANAQGKLKVRFKSVGRLSYLCRLCIALQGQPNHSITIKITRR